MAEEYPRPSSAWTVAEVLDLKPLPALADGQASTLCEAEIKIRVLVKSKDVEILNGPEINKGDLVSGFLNLEFRKNDPKKTNVYLGGIRKYVPKDQRVAEPEPVNA